MKPTLAQLWLVHTLETLFFGSIVTGAIAVYSAMNSGNYDVASLAGIFIPAVIAVLSKGASTSIFNNANLLPAINDSLNDLKDLVGQGTPGQAPLVVVHATQPSVASPQAPVTEQPTQVQIPIPNSVTAQPVLTNAQFRGPISMASPGTATSMPDFQNSMPLASVGQGVPLQSGQQS